MNERALEKLTYMASNLVSSKEIYVLLQNIKIIFYLLFESINAEEGLPKT